MNISFRNNYVIEKNNTNNQYIQYKKFDLKKEYPDEFKKSVTEAIVTGTLVGSIQLYIESKKLKEKMKEFKKLPNQNTIKTMIQHPKVELFVGAISLGAIFAYFSYKISQNNIYQRHILKESQKRHC